MVLALVDEAGRQGARLEQACRVLGLSKRTVQRWRKQGEETDDRRREPTRMGRRANPNALSPAEQDAVLALLNSEEFRSMSPHKIVPLLADRGVHVASESSMYRLLRRERQLVHRGLTRSPQSRAVPRLLAEGPNQVWTWDITYLATTCRGIFFYLYLIVDIWSRRIMGYAVHDQQLESHAAELFRTACASDHVDTARLTAHNDNGAPMRGSSFVATLHALSVTLSYSRPSVSNDNPYSESLFRTLKYHDQLPMGVFESIADARDWVETFVHWYNTQHLHSGIRFVTPDQRHYGEEAQILTRREQVYEAARRRNPNRWSGETRNWTPIASVAINPEVI